MPIRLTPNAGCDTPAPDVQCPLCCAPMHYRGHWPADPDGYGSQSDGPGEKLYLDGIRAALSEARDRRAGPWICGDDAPWEHVAALLEYIDNPRRGDGR